MRTANGNVLWDCISLLDDATKEIVKGLGGLIGVAISHPHYYSSMVEWAHAFDAPIHLHAADRQWVMRPDPAIKFWDGDTLTLGDGVTLIRAAAISPAARCCTGRKAATAAARCFRGDIVQVIPDRKFVTFMRSYPNMIPLSAPSVERIGTLLEPYKYDVIHGAWFDRTIPRGGKDVVKRSIARYVAAVRGDGSAELRKTEESMARIDRRQTRKPFAAPTATARRLFEVAAAQHADRAVLGADPHPDIAEPADHLVNYYRSNPKLGRRLIELIILMLCRSATVQYAWSVHEPHALKEGISQDVIDAIRAKKRPDFKRDDERLIYDFVTELLANKTVSAATFERTKAAFGLDGVIEAVTCSGLYGMIGLVLNVFDIPPQPGKPLT